MNYVNYLKQFVVFVLVFSMGSFAFAFPEFEFSESNYGSGELDVSFSASRGVKVSLYSNEDFVDSIDVFGDTITIELGDVLKTEIVPVNSNVVFKNVHPTNVYQLTIELRLIAF